MPVLKATSQAIEEAAATLRSGGLVAFPTETVYGLGADATNARAVAAVFEAKGRPRFNPLIVHVADAGSAQRLGHFNALARRLADVFWPGPLSLVVQRLATCPVVDLATVGLATIALRVPAHEVAQTLLKAAAVPVAAPSANRSGHVSPTTAAHVEADLGGSIALVLDGGATPIGLESTVVDVTGDEPLLLRPGAVMRADIARASGRPVLLASDDNGRPASPGRLARHYAPAARLRLNATDVLSGEGLLAFGARVPEHAGPMVNLSPSGDLREAAANLFSALRTLDRSGAAVIAVMPIPNDGLGEAINDRLRRAAASEEP
jgi:L-threonylcarbamoyladenylate synthase